MSGDWIAFAVVAMAAAAVVFLPGMALGAALRLRGLSLVAFAPVATTAMAGVLAVLYEKVGLPWSWLTFTVGVVTATGLAWLCGRWLGTRPGQEVPGRRVWVPIGIGIGAILIATRFLIYLGAPDAVSQTNDAVFHLNAIRYVLETQSASSLTVSGVLGSTSFYPAAWHALVSLVVGLTGAGIPMVVNAISLVIASMLWPVGIAWFTLVVTRSRSAAAVAAVLGASMIHFPMLMLQWGVLYPNELSIALVPATLAVVLSQTGRDDVGRFDVRGWSMRALLGAISLAALALAQPVAVLTWSMLLACFVFVRFAVQGNRRVQVRIALGAVTVLALAVVWLAISRFSGGSHWGPYGDWIQALRELLLTSQVELPPMPVLTILMGLGLIAAGRRPAVVWLAFAWVGLALLMGIATSVASPIIRHGLLGPWYADQYRIAATLPLISVPLMAVGVDAVAHALVRRAKTLERIGAERIALVMASLVSTGILLVAPVVQMPLITEGIVDKTTRYSIDDNTYLSVDERDLIQQLPRLVPADATVIGNPSTGMGFTFALSGVDAIPKTWSPPGGSDWDLIAQHLRDASEMPEVCDALDVLGGADFVVDFGLGETTAGRFKMPGLTDFDGQPGFTFVAREGQASLWRISACS